MERLHLAARQGDLALVQSLIAEGCDLDAPDEYGRTPLCMAAREGQARVVEFLISKGADVNTGRDRGYTPLYEAGDRLAWGRGYEETVRLLLANGAEIPPGDTYGNRSLLYHSVAHGMHTLVEKSLVAGADPNTVDRGRTGRSALGEAVALGDVESAKLLIAYGADVNGEDEQYWVPLQYARRWSKEVVELLLAEGADVHARLFLHLFVNVDEPEIMEVLLEHGADVNRKDWEGKTPLDLIIAFNPGHKVMIELLERHGGVRSR